MQLCWTFESEQRPSFVEILSMFEKLRDKIEFQDDKPYPPSCGQYNGAFDLSQDSTSSEKMDADRGIYNQGYNEMERLSEQSRFGSSYQLPSFASSARSPFLLPSNLASYETPNKKSSFVADSEKTEDMRE
ncbi:hypothetical protein TELCIR_00418 [Teladorsagia circumcincta]|uniref:Uncharacterized protein n=1 Tax=Teladorsagia circumcincta TaxID=45464 RepID=A0A2G9V6W8_TELCI|nr:hypothetical protein TELCIR_00418 [Teladorsagia circumcincta]